MNPMRNEKWIKIILEISMILLSLMVVFPILFTVISSFKNQTEISYPLSFPSSVYLGNYISAWTRGKFPILFINSITVAITTILLLVMIGSIASYVLGRRSEKRFHFFYLYMLSGIMIPFQAGMVPLYRLIKNIGLTNKLMALILISLGHCIPVAILIYTGFIKTIPRQLDEAATIDGCGYTGTFYKIILPLLKPATISVIIININIIWNDFMSPLIFITRDKKRTLPVGIYMYMSDRNIDFGPIFAIVILSILAPIIIFLMLQKHFYKGIVAGSVKG